MYLIISKYIFIFIHVYTTFDTKKCNVSISGEIVRVCIKYILLGRLFHHSPRQAAWNIVANINEGFEIQIWPA